jgi:hypothetical protein
VETLLMVERPQVNLVNAAVTVGLQIAAGFVLIPVLGATGAALAMLVGLGGQGILRFAELRYVFGWSWPWGSLTRPAAAFAVSFLPALAVQLMWTHGTLLGEVAAVLIFTGLYAAAWRRLGADPADREIWRRLRGHAPDPALDSAQRLTRQ